MSEDIELLRRVQETPNNQSGIEEVKGFALNKPTLLVFGGMGTDNIDNADENAKIIQMLLTGSSKEFPPDVQIISAKYPVYQPIDYVKEVRQAQKEDYYSDKVAKLFKQQFAPLLRTATTPENPTPRKLPIETVKSNLRNINIVSYSYGGSIAVQLSNAMRASMEKLQYSEQEISQAMQQISLLTLGSVGNIANQKNQFTTLNILNPGDEMVAKHSKNLKTAQAIDPETNIPTPISGDQRQMIILQEVDAIRLKLSSAGISETSEPDPHKPINYVNFLQGENDIVVASPAAIYAANSLIHSVESLQSGFTPLPTVAQMLNEIPPPIEELAKRFNTANKSKQRI